MAVDEVVVQEQALSEVKPTAPSRHAPMTSKGSSWCTKFFARFLGLSREQADVVSQTFFTSEKQGDEAPTSSGSVPARGGVGSSSQPGQRKNDRVAFLHLPREWQRLRLPLYRSRASLSLQHCPSSHPTSTAHHCYRAKRSPPRLATAPTSSCSRQRTSTRVVLSRSVVPPTASAA